MKSNLYKVISLLLITGLLFSNIYISAISASSIPKLKAPSPITNKAYDGYIVKMKSKASLKGFSNKDMIKKQSLVKVSSSEAKELVEEGKAVSKEPNYIRKLAITPNDPYYPYQYGLRRISAPAGWDIERGLSNDVTVAVVDTGVDLYHNELAARIVQGYDFANNDWSAQDDHGHGTHVAGIIAGRPNNSSGIAGISWGASIMPIKVLDSYGMGSDFDVANGIIWAVDHGAKVINLSLGGSWWSSTLENATTYAYNNGAIVFAAAGNDGDSTISYPAGNPNVVGVAATDESDRRAWFSNYNSSVDVSAPGVDVLSTYYDGSHSYAYMSGTSMATPHACGVAAVLFSQDPTMTPSEVAAAMKVRSNDLGPAGRDNYYGYGRINLTAALQDDLSLTYSYGSSRVNFGQRISVKGSLRPMYSSQRISIKKKIFGSSTWRSVTTATTDSNGLFSFANTPTAGSYYSFSWGGSGSIGGSSDQLKVYVKPKVLLSASRYRIRKGRALTVYGYVYPRHRGKRVTVYIYKSGRRSTKYLTLGGSWSDKSKYSWAWRPGSRGTYRVRVKFGDTDHMSNYSRLIYIKVL